MVVLALLPLLILLVLMLTFRWSSPRAGLAAWFAALAIGALAFGLNPPVFWVSQAKGLLLSLYVLAIFWPALFLYHLIEQAGGIRAISTLLESGVGERGLLALVLAWAFSGFLEGLAGFGIPIVVVAPMLVGLGIAPVAAVAAVAVGHSWAVTFGDMGVIFQTLLGVVQMDASQIIPAASLLLGVACLACGLGAAALLGQLRRWPLVVLLGLLMAGVQYGLAAVGLAPLAAFGAGLAGVSGALIYGYLRGRLSRAGKVAAVAQPGRDMPAVFPNRTGLGAAVSGYGMLTILMLLVALPGPVRSGLSSFLWQAAFPQVTTLTGYVTPASLGPAFRVLVHPGTIILLVALICVMIFSSHRYGGGDAWKPALAATWRAGKTPSLGIIATLGLSSLMEHTGMTMLLAQGLSQALGQAFPLVSPWVGILGAFASGSNNNSNVLFGMLQKNAALLIGIAPALMVAAQTAGGSLGSMIAPAKLVVGCSTAGIQGRDGEVLRKTLPYGLGIGLLVGAITLLLALAKA